MKTISPEILIELGFREEHPDLFSIQIGTGLVVYYNMRHGVSIHSYLRSGQEFESVDLKFVSLVQLKALLFGLTGQPIYYIPSQGERTKESFEETKDVYKNHSVETLGNEAKDVFDRIMRRQKEMERFPLILTEKPTNANEWISTKESLPPRKQVVLLWSEHRGLEIGQRSELEGNWYNDESIFLENENVLFWCEIPPTLPFKENQDE